MEIMLLLRKDASTTFLTTDMFKSALVDFIIPASARQHAGVLA